MDQYSDVITKIDGILPQNTDWFYILDFKGIELPVSLLCFFRFNTPYRIQTNNGSKVLKSIIIPITVTNWRDIETYIKTHPIGNSNNLPCKVDGAILATGGVSSKYAPQLSNHLQEICQLDQTPFLNWRFYYTNVSLNASIGERHDPSALDIDSGVTRFFRTTSKDEEIDMCPNWEECKAKLSHKDIKLESSFVRLVNHGTGIGKDIKQPLNYLFKGLDQYFTDNEFPILENNRYYAYLLINTRTHDSTDQIDIIVLIAPTEEKVQNQNYTITCIEVKEHGDYEIRYPQRSKPKVMVQYKNSKPKDALAQTEGGVFAYSNFLRNNMFIEKEPPYKKTFGDSPCTQGSLWFPRITQEDFVLGGYTPLYHGYPKNLELIEKIVKNTDYRLPQNQIYLTQSFFKHQIDSPSIAPTNTKRYMENLSMDRVKDIFSNGYFNNFSKSKKIGIQGAPGTGKTYHLLAIGFTAIPENPKPALFLSYNHVLIAYINHIIPSYRETLKNTIKDKPIREHIHASSLISWYVNLLKEADIEISGKGKEFYENAQNTLKNAATDITIYRQHGFDNLKAFKSIEDIENLKNKIKDEYSMILIDEAQDLTDHEQTFITLLCADLPIAVSVSKSQRMRHQTDKVIFNDLKYFHVNATLGKILRSQNQIAKFIAKFNQNNKLGEEIEIEPVHNEGNIEIDRSSMRDDYMNSLTQKILEAKKKVDEYNTTAQQPICYNDILVLIPPPFNNNGNIVDVYKNMEGLRSSLIPHGIGIYMMTEESQDKNSKNMYPQNPDLVRVMNYQSCRGSEGWIVLLLCFDKYYDYLRDRLHLTEKEIQEHLFMAVSRGVSSMNIYFYDGTHFLCQDLNNILCQEFENKKPSSTENNLYSENTGNKFQNANVKTPPKNQNTDNKNFPKKN